MDEDEKDRAKRASRNKSEKKRRDQFNVLIKELCTMLQGHGHPLKMDKSTILQRTIDFLQKQKEITAQTEACQIRQDWKPSFLSNEEFTQLMLEALDGFLIALTTDGIIIYVSDSVSSLLGHLPSDLVDQNILNFLPEGEQSEVYKLLSPHVLMTDPVAADFLNAEKQIEFCCHLARGSLDPNEPLMYEYVKFVVDFKYFTDVPTPSCNGFESAIARAFRSATEEQICLVATVRLVTPQFLKELCNTEEPYEEFTSRHSLEWKFLFLDHRAPPIIGYLPFEVLGTSGYDYYHADDLELLARCHEHLMQFGKGKSCYYRFLTKGQQWIWLQTHYYITYHQWNSKPEFIVCTHLVVSYAEVRAERRRDLGLEESSIELASSSLKSHSSYLDVGQCGSSQDASREGVSLSSHSSQHSSHTTLSNSTSTSSLRHTETSTPTRLSVPGASGEKTALRLATVRSTQAIAILQAPGEHLCQHPVAQLAGPSQNPLMPVYHFPTQLGMMHQLKEQLEERTRILQADIKTQQEELHVIKEQLQLVQDSNLQMLMQQPIPVILNTVQQPSPRRPPPQGTPRQTTAKKSQQPVLMGTKHYCSTHLLSPHPFLRDPCGTVPQVQQQKQQHPIRGSQGQQLCVPGQASISVPFYNNPMVFSQTHPITVAAQVPTDSSERQPPADYSQDRSLRMLLDQSIQAMMPTANSNCQPLQSSASRQQGKLVAEQQTLPPPAQVQPATCSTIRPPAPPPIFSPSLMIPHSSFTSHQASTPVHLHQWPQQQVQQHHLYLQMQGPELVPGAPIQRIFQPSHTPQQNPLSYFLHPQQQSHHTQGQPCNLPDLPEMQLP
ncbi:PREDICTED: PAS domain-containing protein 1 isoform X1 [Pseudopodoces humilis]|uniref:PAS domain-containing protein 1 isoform X1 n=1 Tax=Pseudopodoces humilis TaxID=181119 RepID=UPI0006B6CB28|nr:PREDICTED: PAS domain-containing protein 1 isoform X1 [Pseudopodoces humilis]XP_014116432.1 PREDICTED: PAS domain-containing protein 1 isoform X1 [Pseudopodoces humilis]XP_014116433.1 PREDICTED: PAS domain-containing protein 1 isoform X1 [Pseudopodoces humilis]XP_014116434.1 PREDICTED: PAS domain-containing protein 1 isoform X1 [Pseudopodoces humilis]